MPGGEDSETVGLRGRALREACDHYCVERRYCGEFAKFCRVSGNGTRLALLISDWMQAADGQASGASESVVPKPYSDRLVHGSEAAPGWRGQGLGLVRGEINGS